MIESPPEIEAPQLALTDLARLANEAHHAAEGAAVSALENARAAGEYLTMAKAGCKHGEWSSWLEGNFSGSDRTARRYMRVNAHWEELAKRTDLSVLSLEAALAELTEPRESHPEPVAHISASPDTPEAREALWDARSRERVEQEMAQNGGWIDDGSGEMVHYLSQPPEVQAVLMQRAISEESYERMMRQRDKTREHFQGHDMRGHLTPEGREERAKRILEEADTIRAERGEIYPTLEELEARTSRLLEEDARQRGERPHVAHNSGNNEWYTPPEFLDAARTVLGGIDLDPASSEKANENVQASMFYTAEDDGLQKDWAGTVWLNPPYSGDLVGKFAQKLVKSVHNGPVPAAVVLVNNATETAWFQHLASNAAAVCFPKGRIRYLDETGTQKQSPLQGQAFLYFGRDKHLFKQVFGQFGVVR